MKWTLADYDALDAAGKARVDAWLTDNELVELGVREVEEDDDGVLIVRHIRDRNGNDCPIHGDDVKPFVTRIVAISPPFPHRD